MPLTCMLPKKPGCAWPAIVNDMVMVTENLKHFKNYAGIRLENWIER